MNLRGKIARSSVTIFYLLIGLEIIIMFSPFVAYFYAGYGPLLNTLYAFPGTAWLTGFFLPHAVVLQSDLLNFINGFGRTLFSLAIISFLIGAFQIYTAKNRRKGVDVDTKNSQVLNYRVTDVAESLEIGVQYWVLSTPAIIINDRLAFRGVPKEKGLREKLEPL